MTDIPWNDVARGLFEESREALFLVDLGRHAVLDANPAAERLAGRRRNELRGTGLTDLFTPESADTGGWVDALFRPNASAPRNGYRTRGRDRIPPVPVQLQGRHWGTVGMLEATAVLERPGAREERCQSEERRLLTEQMPAVIWTMDVDLRFTSSRGAALTGLNLRPDEVVGKTLYEYLGTDDPNVPIIALHRRALAGQPGNVEFNWQGHVFLAHVEPLADTAGCRIGVIGVALDVTESRWAEERLHALNAFLDSIIENIPDMVFVKDAASLKFERLNRAGEELLGRPRHKVIGKTNYELFPQQEADFFTQMDRTVLQGRTLADVVEESVPTPRGERILRTKKIPLLDERGEPRYLLGIAEDITERRVLEDRLRQAQKMEAVGQLAGGVAHDFNNLLTVILGNVGLSLTELPAEHPCREFLTAAEQAAQRAAALTRQLLGFSRRTHLEAEPINVNTCVEETVRLLRRTFDPRITLQVDLQTDLWQILADPGQMSQVLMNLCLNARDAMPVGGLLVLATANVTLTQAGSTYESRPGDFVRLEVRDTGRGMPPEVQQHLFEPFFTTKEVGKGTGLGLAMVFGIVREHGGWIEWHSEIDQGTCFAVYLPRLADTPRRPQPTELDQTRGGRETILLVDDQEMILRLGRQILTGYGYRVIAARDGEEAVTLYRERQRQIDLVILDLAMPRLSGPDALRALREMNPAVRVLISSGNDNGSESADAPHGALGSVAKPYQPRELARAVRAALDLPCLD